MSNHQSQITNSMLTCLQELFYPTLCPLCQRGVDTLGAVCDSCLQQLPRTEHALMRGNKVEQYFQQFQPFHTMQVRNRFVRAGAWLQYSDQVATLIHRAKYSEQPFLAAFLGRQAAMEWLDTGFFDDIDLLVPVPLHPKRLRERGYNQSEYICHGLAEILHIPVDATNLLRVVNTHKQSLLSDSERKQNVKDAFAVTMPERWHRKHILLVDDVITTGSTLSWCIKEITPIRTCRISVFSLSTAR